jgi:hypothetical protein
VREIHATCRQFVQIRRLEKRMSVHADAVTAVLIRHNHENVRFHGLFVLLFVVW